MTTVRSRIRTHRRHYRYISFRYKNSYHNITCVQAAGIKTRTSFINCKYLQWKYRFYLCPFSHCNCPFDIILMCRIHNFYTLYSSKQSKLHLKYSGEKDTDKACTFGIQNISCAEDKKIFSTYPNTITKVCIKKRNWYYITIF